MKQHKPQPKASNFPLEGVRIKNLILTLFRSDFIVRYNLKKPSGQTLLEYLVLIGIVTAVVAALSPYMKRSVQSIIKVTADQLAVQTSADQGVSGSYLINALSRQNVTTSKQLQEAGATKTYIYNDVTSGSSQSLTNLGFSQRGR